jgi:cation transport ATPase
MNYQVVHNIAGRLRVRISRLQWDSEFASKLTWLVESLAGVTSVRINPAASSLVITYRAGGACSEGVWVEVETCIHKAGFPESNGIPDGASVEERTPEDIDPGDTELEPEINHWQDLGLPALSLGVALLAAPLELPVVVVGAAIAGAALPWFMRAADSLVNHHQPNIDLLDSLWMTLQTVQGNYAAPALKTCMVEARRSLRGVTTEDRVKEALKLLAWFEQPIWVERDGRADYICVNAIRAGDRVRVRAGERIPVDGWVLQGTALVDERQFTEDLTPLLCHPGDEVYAATLVVQGQLTIVAQRAGVNSRMGLTAQLIQLMPVHDTQIGVHQAEFLRAAIFPTILFGGAMFALTGNFGAAVSPFQFDFGSGVPISVHTTLLSALTYAARCGIYIRSARVLEHLTQIDAVVFDQTGVLASDNGNNGTADLRQGCLSAIAILQQQGVAVYWTTPDTLSIAHQQATHLGIPAHHTYAKVTPDQTSDLVSALRHQGKTVAFVGDSTHTAAFAQASISIAFAADREISQVPADVVLMGDTLEAFVHAIAIAKRSLEVVYQNTAIIVVPNLLIQIGGGMILGVNPIVNVITNNSSAFVAEFVHGARPLFDKHTPAPVTFRSHKPRMVLPESPAPVFAVLGRSLKQSALAKRLGVTSQSLTSRRTKPEFTHWTQNQDPEGRAWKYDAATQFFYAV